MQSTMRGLCAGLLAAAAAVAGLALPAAAQQTTSKGKTSAQPVRNAAPADKGMAAQSAAPVCAGEIAGAVSVPVAAGKSTMIDLQRLRLPAPAWLRTIGTPDLLQVEPTTSATARSNFFLFGKRVGSTNLMFQDREGRCGLVEVVVGIDAAAVQAQMRQLLPEEKNIQVLAAADSLILSGMVSDALVVDKAMLIANAFVRRSLGTGLVPGGAQGAAAGVAPAAFGTPGGGAAGGAGGANSDRVVNMLSVAAPQQVMLEVKVAEVAKVLLDQLGVSLSGTLNSGSWASTLAASFSNNGGGILNFLKTTTGEFVRFDAEKRDGLVKILAEPNIMAVSGQEGSFLAGGKIFIPVAQTGFGTAATITLEEKEFGVGLRFTPTVLEGGRINMKVAPEVSELSREGIGITATNTAGSAILPLMTTRRAATTVQLYDGQSFAIGGLIKNNVTQNIKAFPFLGEVPVLGTLFRSTSFQSDMSELVFIVTPRLVKPLPPDYPLPTDAYVQPSRNEYFFGGRMEGTPPPAPPQGGLPQGFQAK